MPLVTVQSTSTRKYIEIREVGSQQRVRKIECTLQEAETIMQEIAQALYHVGYYEKRKADIDAQTE